MFHSGEIISNGITLEATPPMVLVDGRPCLEYVTLRLGRLAVFWSLLLLLVESRPFNFFPAIEPKGRQCIFIATSGVFPGSFVTPSDTVPGGDEALVRKKLWT
jgi:hypothetical protein